MAENTRRVSAVLTLFFLVVAAGLAYWQVFAAPGLTSDPTYNAFRLQRIEQQTKRGRILDRNGAVLAESVPGAANEGFRRVYALPSLAGVVGYHDAVYGNAGVEESFDQYLGGTTGVGLIARLRSRLYHEPIVGADIVLTIDLALQQAADSALGDGPGAIVVMDPRTGEILALVSHPYYDANNLTRDWPKLLESADHPLLNRATQGLYTPGSVFKTVTLAAALDLNEYQPTTKFTCNSQVVVEGFPIKCETYFTGTFDLSYAYAYSCNPCFGEVGLRLGGPDLTDYARRFGFESAIPLEVPTAASQIATGDPEKRLVGPLLASTAFGQGELLATPLQMALVAAAVANDGVAPAPRLVLRVQGEGGTLFESSARPWRTVVRPEAAHSVLTMMARGVDDGLASAARIPGVKVGGKTGTAEVGPGQQTHAWFIGVAPTDAPRFVVAVLKEHGGGGGTVATPIGHDVLKAALK